MNVAINLTEGNLASCAFQTPFDPDVFDTVSCPVCGVLIPVEDVDVDCPNGCDEG